jgi:hypothetical protein
MFLALFSAFFFVLSRSDFLYASLENIRLQNPDTSDRFSVDLYIDEDVGSVEVELTHTVDDSTLNLLNNYFGFGFGNDVMENTYALIVEGNNDATGLQARVSEHRLAVAHPHHCGFILAAQALEFNVATIDNTRVVNVRRPIEPVSNDHYSFRGLQEGDVIPFIYARGNDPEFIVGEESAHDPLNQNSGYLTLRRFSCGRCRGSCAGRCNRCPGCPGSNNF